MAASLTHTPAVLLVDDRPENLLALEAVLEPLGVRLRTATSGEEALRALLAEDFAVVLLDVQMPGMDGFETARFIRGRDRSATTPIIFLTAVSTDVDHVVAGYDAGAVDYLLKP
ncbi:MAG TPA: response regulator, partial [Kofleriaceae bacterium]|nr:response regulator [Kofleriaceae bacterium]